VGAALARWQANWPSRLDLSGSERESFGEVEVSEGHQRATESVRAGGEWLGSLSRKAQRVGGRSESSRPHPSYTVKLSRLKTALSRNGAGGANHLSDS
jgi:hypothetical protein